MWNLFAKYKTKRCRKQNGEVHSEYTPLELKQHKKEVKRSMETTLTPKAELRADIQHWSEGAIKVFLLENCLSKQKE